MTPKTKKRGRPPKAPEARRSVRVEVALTEGEAARLRDAFAAYPGGLSGAMRALALEEARRREGSALALERRARAPRGAGNIDPGRKWGAAPEVDAPADFRPGSDPGQKWGAGAAPQTAHAAAPLPPKKVHPEEGNLLGATTAGKKRG